MSSILKCDTIKMLKDVGFHEVIGEDRTDQYCKGSWMQLRRIRMHSSEISHRRIMMKLSMVGSRSSREVRWASRDGDYSSRKRNRLCIDLIRHDQCASIYLSS
ncbi:uncharacterized protein LOC109834012 [Asparagus officinalis]|uniref:uncharacterized protein LOC109834012 n=1 Tax=Asparagus officinalis TaxID=4686 RepID=UPI00098DE995|nr:uncharacterized protein LOC109834012 [Asparagus officinalis]